IIIPCSCGAQLRVVPKATPAKAKCPKCGQIVNVPSAVPASVSATPPTTATRCLQCGVPMPAGATACAVCGHGMPAGSPTRATAYAPASRPTRGTVRAAGAIVIGTIICAVGAVVGATIWVIVAYYLHSEVGYIAWGTGVLAGLGMKLGARVGSTQT